MSDLNASVTSTIYTVKAWRGVNENPDGDTNLKSGEAAVMRNFKVTDGGALKKRPGSDDVGRLLSGAGLAPTGKIITQCDGGEESSRTLYSSAVISSSGLPVVSGTKTVCYAGGTLNEGKYIQLSSNSVGRLKQTASRARTILYSGTVGTLNASSIGFLPQALVFDNLTFDFSANKWAYGSYEVVSLAAALANPSKLVGRYAISLAPGRTDERSFVMFNASSMLGFNDFADQFNNIGYMVRVLGVSYASGQYTIRGDVIQEALFEWDFEEMTVTASADRGTEVSCLWSGFVAGREHILAACNGYVWDLTKTDGAWSIKSVGTCASEGRVAMFGYSGKVYILDGLDYYSWDGTTYQSVEGYVPCIAVSSSPSGGGVAYEQVNKLTPKKSQRFSSDGSLKFYLAEQNIAAVYQVMVDGMPSSLWTVNTTTGCVTFGYIPTVGINNVEIFWRSGADDRSTVLNMRYSEMYSGKTDNRVFLYGDGTNRCIYSGITETGLASAEYFPDMNEAKIGDENTELTGLIRHYDKLLAFKKGSAWSIYYDTISLDDGSVTAGFFVTPVNRSLGNDAPGQVCLVDNSPVTIDGRSIYEWRSTGNITNDQRNAQRISQRVEDTLSKFDFENTLCYFDKINHEYYAVCGGTAVVYSTDIDAWYIYTGFPATAMIVYDDEVYFGTADGYLRHFSDDYAGDAGQEIDCYWQSGSLSMGKDFTRKYSPSVWVGMKPEPGARIDVGIRTPEGILRGEVCAEGEKGAEPKMIKVRLKRSKFTYYTLIFSSCSSEDRATLCSCDVHIKYTGRVK